LDRFASVRFATVPIVSLRFVSVRSVRFDSCHHGMARPQFADRVTASDMEGSCEDID